MQEKLKQFFDPLFDLVEDGREYDITISVLLVVSNKLQEMDEAQVTDEIIEQVFEDSIVEGVIVAVMENDTIPPNEKLYNIGRYFDHPGKWYYNLQNAIKYYLSSASIEHNARASFNLGCSYFDGMTDEKNHFTLEKNYSYAAAYFYFACAKEEPSEQCKFLYYLALMYFYGWGVKQDLYRVIQLGNMGHDYRCPSTFYERLNNLALAAMNLLDGKDDGVSDAILANVSMSEEVYQSLKELRLSERQGKLDLLKARKKMHCSGEFTQKCSRCGADMVMRVVKKEDSPYQYPMFLGCVGYPDCKNTISVLAMDKFQ